MKLARKRRFTESTPILGSGEGFYTPRRKGSTRQQYSPQVLQQARSTPPLEPREQPICKNHGPAHHVVAKAHRQELGEFLEFVQLLAALLRKIAAVHAQDKKWRRQAGSIRMLRNMSNPTYTVPDAQGRQTLGVAARRGKNSTVLSPRANRSGRAAAPLHLDLKGMDI